MKTSTFTDDGYGIPPFAASARMQFVTPQTGWLIGASLHPDNSSYSWLYVTHNGGRHWATVPIQTTYTRLYAYNFVSPALGWALADNRASGRAAVNSSHRHPSRRQHL